MKLTIDTGVFDTPEASAYFSKSDHRILCGCRATLEMLGIPLPGWALRKPTGPKPGKFIAAAYRADHPETLHQATVRKSQEAAARLPEKADDAPRSLAERVADLRARSTAQPHSTTCPDGVDPLTTAPIDTSFLG